MRYTRTGVILCTENYERCVDFYSRVLELPILYSLDNVHSKLTCCDIGSCNYLMVETEGTAVPQRKTLEQNPVWRRFNVKDVGESAKQLSDRGVIVTVTNEKWGTVADFTGPDGNHCSLRDEGSFMPQVPR